MSRLSTISDGVATPLAMNTYQNLIIASVETDSWLLLFWHSYLLNSYKGPVFVISQIQVLQFVKLAFTQPLQLCNFIIGQVEMLELSKGSRDHFSEMPHLSKKVIAEVDALDGGEYAQWKGVNWLYVVVMQIEHSQPRPLDIFQWIEGLYFVAALMKRHIRRSIYYIFGIFVRFKGYNVLISFEAVICSSHT